MRTATLPLLIVLSLISTLPSMAQEAHQAVATGALVVERWPEVAVEAGVLTEEQLQTAALLPDIDRVRLDYELMDEDGRARLHLQLSWQHGAFGWVDGKRVPYDALPDDVRLDALTLHARAVHDGLLTDFYLPLSRLELRAEPAVFEATVDTLAWRELFPQIPSQRARRLLEEGFTLEQPQILSASFITDDRGFYTRLADRPENGRTRRQQPEPTVVSVDPGVWIDIWVSAPPRRIYRDPYRIPTRPRGSTGRDGTVRPDTDDRSRPAPRARVGSREGSASGDERTSSSRRTDTTRSARGLSDLFDREKEDDDDDDDDDKTLLPAALVGVAAVGVLAYAGGTIGYYGNAAEAPIGLAAGYAGQGGGLLLQVAVNDAVLRQDDDVPEHLIAKATGFFDAFHAPLQPAFGLGAYVEELDGDVDVTPSLSLGGILRQGPALIYVGYDLAAAGLDLGLAFNFRHRRLHP